MNKTMQSESFKFEIPETCHVSILKKVLIEKLDAKYLLTVHPRPSCENEMLIFKPRKEDQKESDEIVYRDYSLRKRIESTQNKETTTKKKLKKLTSKKGADEEKKALEPKLQCLDVDLCAPLCEVEWRNWCEVISEVEGMGWFQILPVG